jgi:ankyrin repeat protein
MEGLRLLFQVPQSLACLNIQELKNKDTPLHVVCRMGRSDLLQVLVSPIQKTESNVPSLLNLCCEYIVKNGVAYERDLLPRGLVDLLHETKQRMAMLSQVSMPKASFKADPTEVDLNLHNNQEHSALYIATAKQSVECVRILLGLEGIDINGQPSPWLEALSRGNPEIIELFLEKEALCMGVSSLDYAARSLGWELFHKISKILLSREFQGNKKRFRQLVLQTSNKEGQNLLHVASRWGNYDLIPYLVTKWKFDVTAPDKNICASVFHWASLVPAERVKKTFQSLLKVSTPEQIRSLTFELRTRNGDLPLHWAASKYGSMSAVECLLGIHKGLLTQQEGSSSTSTSSLGMEINRLFTNSVGDTPLHVIASVKRDSEARIRLLLDAGFDPWMRNKKGELPIQVASSNQAHQSLGVLARYFTVLQPQSQGNAG